MDVDYQEYKLDNDGKIIVGDGQLEVFKCIRCTELYRVHEVMRNHTKGLCYVCNSHS